MMKGGAGVEASSQYIYETAGLCTVKVHYVV